MPTLATGRLAFWEGGSLWVFDVPPSPDAASRNALHAHHAFQLTFSLGGSYRVHLETDAVAGPYSIVAPDTLHAFEAQGLVALLFIAPESAAGRSLLLEMRGRPAAPITEMQVRDAPELIRQAYAHTSDPRTALRDTGMLIASRIAGHAPRTAEPDRRVRQMISWANSQLDTPVTLDTAARSAGLSPSRASHLFVEETGLPFRTYVLWLRIQRAVEAHAHGASLTEAAQEAGFSDSAHLSRTFRRMFGLPASSLEMS